MAFNKARAALIEQSVRSYLQNNALEAFSGLVTTDEVIKEARHTLQRVHRVRFSEVNRGQTYDWIRDLGPEGEDDVKWLKKWRVGA